MTVPIWPTVNASLNALAAFFLFLGWLAILSNEREQHKRMMICALISSTVFLVSYLFYHYSVGSVKYQGVGLLRKVYFTILLTHTPLAAIVPPLAITAVYHAMKENFSRHIRITRVLYPIWIYVSLTGVVIYAMLYIFS